MNRTYRRSKLKEKRQKLKEDKIFIKIGIDFFQLYKKCIDR